MDGLVNCGKCDHGLVTHGDYGCEERGCACAASHRIALEAEIAALRWTPRVEGVAVRARGGRDRDPDGPPLGERIRALRVAHGWSQTELARRSGVERTSLQRIEACKRQDPGFSIVACLADALETSLDALVGAPSHDALLERIATLERELAVLGGTMTSAGVRATPHAVDAIPVS